MEKRTLNNLKQFINDDQSFDTPVAFKEDKPAVTIPKSKKFEKIPAVIFDAIGFLDAAEKLDYDEFQEFLASKSNSINVKTNNDIFNKRAYDADVRAIERKYNEETDWLKMNMPKTPDEMSKWTDRLKARDQLRSLLPNKTDRKYFSKEVVVVTKSGPECKRLLEQFKDAYNDMVAEAHERTSAAHFEEHHLTMDNETFAFIKMMHKLGQVNYDFYSKIPAELIHSGNNKVTVRDDLEYAVANFNSVAEYNEYLKSADIPMSDTDRSELQVKQLALMSDDLELAAHAISNYATEFMALKQVASLDKPFK